MKPIRLVQWGSTIALLVAIAFILGIGGILLMRGESVAELVKLAGVVLLFIAPEKLAAFFGPALKRRQNGAPKDGGQ